MLVWVEIWVVWGPEGNAKKQVQQGQAFFVRACLNNPEDLVGDYGHHERVYPLSLLIRLSASDCVHVPIKKGGILCII